MDQPGEVVEQRNGEVGGNLRIGWSLVVLLVLVSIEWFGGMAEVMALVGIVGMVWTICFGLKCVLIPMVRGIPCPQCGERQLVRVACISFGDRFYRCPCCGLRCKRESSAEPWLDASGREDDPIYKRKPGSSWFSLLDSLPTKRDRINAAEVLTVILSPFIVGPVSFWLAPDSRWIIPLSFLWVWQVDLIFGLTRRGKRDKTIGPAIWDQELDG